ncbi:MAG: LysR family transcriptional regulator [Pseudomonadales bacterium]|nr:LysR family transcriptional regulator [Pseudomonadales bacterium]
MRYTLRQLEVFVATARQENLGRAAASLSMSQSAASGALAELERQFDVQLFDRVGKRLQLNEPGRSLLPRAEELLVRARELEQSLGRRGEAGSLRVGATLSIGNYLAVPVMTRYMEAHPNTQITLDVANTASIVAKVARFELDIGLIEGVIRHPELEVIPWRDDELVVFCAPTHPLAKETHLGEAQLLAAQWILREPGSGTRQTFDRAMHGLLPRLHILFELQHTEAIKRAVESGIGIGCLSRATLGEAFRRKSLVPLEVPGRDFSRQFSFILHRKKYRSAGIDHWMRMCRDAAA